MLGCIRGQIGKKRLVCKSGRNPDAAGRCPYFCLGKCGSRRLVQNAAFFNIVGLLKTQQRQFHGHTIFPIKNPRREAKSIQCELCWQHFERFGQYWKFAVNFRELKIILVASGRGLVCGFGLLFIGFRTVVAVACGR